MHLEFIKRNRLQILCNVLLIIVFIFCYGKLGDAFVDSFREAYIPEQILNGGVLYKNIFIVYPPLAYLINAFMFFVFGVNLKVLFMSGLIATIGILNLTFKIASEFLPKIYSFAVVLFIIFSAALSTNVFNLFLPYSYGLLYGIFFVLAAVFLCLKNEYFGAYFLFSMAICCKYEFIFLLPLLILQSGKKNILKNSVGFLLPLFITSFILFVQGVSLNDISTSLQWVKSLSSTKTLYWFYAVSGLIFRPQLIGVYIFNLIKYIVPFVFVYYFDNIYVKLLAGCYLFYVIDPEILIYVFPLILILFLIRFKSLNTKKRFFVLASLLVSAKVFFALTLMSYGIYYLPFALISLYIVFPKKCKKALLVLTLFSAVFIGIHNVSGIVSKDYKIQTSKGVFYTYKNYGEVINEVITYSEKNIDQNEKVLVLPEGLIVNFLSDRKSDNKIYSLLPLYTETFGENTVIMRLKHSKPDYILISDYDTSNYYYSRFGQDYAKQIFRYIEDNYELCSVFGKDFKIKLFKIEK